MTTENETQIDPLLIAYLEDGPSPLEEALRAGLRRDEPTYSEKTLRGHRRALSLILPIVEEAGVFTLEQLNDDDGLTAVRSALARAIRQSDLAGSTWEEYISRFVRRCDGADILPAESARLKRTLAQALKQARKPAEIEPEVTDEMLQNLHSVMLEWRDAEIECSGFGQGRKTLVGLVGHRGRAVTPQRRDRALAAIAICWAGTPRTGDVLALKRSDVRGGIVRLQVAKGHTLQPVDKFPLGDLAPFVRPLLARVGNDPDAPLFAGGQTVLSDVREMMISAGWPEHHGRLGLHRLRKCIARVLDRAGHPMEDTAAVLNNTLAVVAKHYAIHDTQDKSDAGRATMRAHLTALTATPPRYRWPEGDEPTPWAMLTGNSWVCNPLDASELLTRARPHDLEVAVTQTCLDLGLEPTPENVACLLDATLDNFLTDDSPPELSGAWRLRWVEVENEDLTWTTYAAAESSQNDVMVANFHPAQDGEAARPLWLERGALWKAHSENPDWCERRDLNPGSSAPLESIVPAYAAAMRDLLDAGDLEAVRRMLDLLAALGGEPA